MKKIFMLLFCVAALGFAAQAQEATLVDQCINTLLTQDQPTRSAQLDVNNDGILSIADVTMLIDIQLQAQQAQQVPAQPMNEINTIIDEALQTTNGQPDIEDVNKAVEKNLKKQQ